MSLTRKDILEMTIDELVPHLDSIGIQYSDDTSLHEIQQLYLEHMEASTSESCEDGPLPPSLDEIQQMGMLKLCEYLEDANLVYDHLESLQEMQELYIEHLKNTSSESPDHQQHHTIMEDIVENDRKMRLGLSAIYDMLMEFLNKGEYHHSIKSIMNAMNREFNSNTLATFKDELMNGECPIVVAGETSAGKSSLLNLILGTDVLAQSILGTTTTVCRLHNSDTKYFEIHRDDDTVDRVDRPAGTWKAALEPYVTSRNPACKQVDVYWPIPMLKQHVTIVDTPGIGENDELTDTLLSYLPKAVAFIYVINSANAGGIQDDYILRILNQQKDWAREGRPTTIDYESTIFVCNKWDRVQDEVEKVWNNAQTKILANLPGFPVDRNVYKLSVAEEDRRRKSGLPMTPKFSKLMQGIGNLVALSMKGKIIKHYTWIKLFLKALQSQMLSRINQGKLSKEERIKKMTDANKRINKLQTLAAKAETELRTFAKEECKKLVCSLDEHLQRADVKKKVLTWDKNDLSTMISTQDEDMFRYQANRAIHARIQDVFKDWETQSIILKDASASFEERFRAVYQELGKECEHVRLLVEGEDEEDTFGMHVSSDNSFLQIMVDNSPTVRDVAALALLKRVRKVSFLVIGIGITTAASILTGGIATIVLTAGAAALSATSTAMLGVSMANFFHIQSNKLRCIKTLAQNALDTVCLNTCEYICVVYFKAFESRISSLCSVVILDQIEAVRMLISNILGDDRKSQAIQQEYSPLLNDITVILEKLSQFYQRELMNGTEPNTDLALD